MNLKYIKAMLFILLFGFSTKIFAHVKWFYDFSFLDKSKELMDIIDPVFIGLTLLSIIVLSALIILDKRTRETAIAIKLNNWLDSKEKYAPDVIRIGMFAVLIISWVNDKVLTPELSSEFNILSWVQFSIAILLLIKRTVVLGGVMLLLTYLFCIYEFGFFYMLDYYHFIGIAFYLITINSKQIKLKSLAIPALYITIGLSLVWLAYEKIFYPDWGISIVEQNPVLAFGLSPDFFIKSAAFIEIGLGILLLLGALERPLAAIITLVFVMTSLVFGKIEVIGHTSLHAMLIVFILKGNGGYFKAPIQNFGSTTKKVVFAVCFYLLINGFGLFMYKQISDIQYDVALDRATSDTSSNKYCAKKIDVSSSQFIPEIKEMEIISEGNNLGYNLHVKIDNWKFTPNQLGNKSIENQGHAHIYIDGKKVGRMYTEWFYLGKLPKGKYKISIALNSDDHTSFTVGNTIIGREITYEVKEYKGNLFD